MDEKKLRFLPDIRVPEVTAKNVEHVTHQVRRPIVNAYLWKHMVEYGMVPYVGIHGKLPSGDIAVHWWPALKAVLLEEQFETSQDPLAVQMRETDELIGSFEMEAKRLLKKLKGIKQDKDPDEALKRFLEWERERLEKGC